MDIMMGLGLSVLTGLIWTLVGIIYSRATGKAESFVSFMFFSSLFFGLSSCLGGGFEQVEATEFVKLSAIMIPVGMLGQFGFLALSGAMKSGSHGVAWSVSQAAMVFPFLTGWLLFGNAVQWWQLLGMVLLLVGLPLLAQRDEADARQGRFVLLCLLAMALLGGEQSLSLLPSHLGSFSSSVLGWRVPLYSLGGVLMWTGFLVCRRHVVWSQWKAGLLYGVVVAAGQLCLYCAIDRMTGLGASGMVHPLAIGSCILFFFVYCGVVRRERSTRRQLAGLACLLAGIFLLALQFGK